ncbi:MAG: Sec-independent protein translocase subunit TatA/TatB [Chloroflexota bacterium]
MFFGHGPELIIVLVIALIVLGPGKLPEVAGMLGRAVRELRKASADLQSTFDVNSLVNPPAVQSVEVTQQVDAAVATVEAEHTLLPNHSTEPTTHVDEAAMPLVLEPALAAPAELAVATKRRRSRKSAAKTSPESTGEPELTSAGASAIEAGSEAVSLPIESSELIGPPVAEAVVDHASSNGSAAAEIASLAVPPISGERRGRAASGSTARRHATRSTRSALPEAGESLAELNAPAPVAPEAAVEPAPPPVLEDAAAPSPRRRRSAAHGTDASETAPETNTLPVQRPVRRKRAAAATANAESTGAVQVPTT